NKARCRLVVLAQSGWYQMPTIKSVVERLLPKGSNYPPTGNRQAIPLWPPDVFAVTATLVEQSGCYSHAKLGGWAPDGLFSKPGYRKKISDLARGWRRVKLDQAGALSETAEMKKLQAIWEALLNMGDCPVNSDERQSAADWWEPAVELLAIADDAAAGIGTVYEYELPGGDGFADFYLKQYSLAIDSHDQTLSSGRDSAANGSGTGGAVPRGERLSLPYLPASLCVMVPPDEVCVQPKTLTAQVGCTLRSLSHNLALLPSLGEVDTCWRVAVARQCETKTEPLNLLVIPFPFRIDGRAFANAERLPRLDHEDADCPRFFSVRPTWLPDRETEQPSVISSYICRLMQAAGGEVDRIHGVIFPELALDTERAFAVSQILASETKLELFISGICDARSSTPGAMGSTHGTNKVYTAASLGNKDGIVANWEQPKHHRWKLEANQIRKYQLANQLDPSFEWLEDIDTSSRTCNFYLFRTSVCMAALVCEDLARIDPVQRVIRSVGPNLVVALLMDGEQRESRWCGQYATVLADDPGSSVLTLTSLGMIRRSMPGDSIDNVPIGLWKQPGRGAQALRLPADADALLLTLSLTKREEWTLDYRSDSRRATVLSLSGVHPITPHERPAWVKRG
ncbi:MAG TPA: hypothetical protein VFI31_27075, partial [Pirellulales bacterium]|nr:hypothetical protein [Pirellulales bacterium]